MLFLKLSILSKKLAAGLEGLVIDVKYGNGAFMKDLNEARNLADSLVNVSNKSGCKTTALVTDMNQPLSQSIGKVKVSFFWYFNFWLINIGTFF